MKQLDEIKTAPEVSVLLNIMKIFSTEVYEHCESVARLSYEIVKNDKDFTDAEKEQVIIGALLHDFGKILVPFNLTQCPRRLNPNEFAIVKTHTLIGYEMLKENFSDIVCNIILYHHEQPNGSGYVNSLPLSQIPKEALLVQVADVYDALISKRNYKSNYNSETALAIMRNDSKNLKLDDEYLDKLTAVINSENEN